MVDTIGFFWRKGHGRVHRFGSLQDIRRCRSLSVGYGSSGSGARGDQMDQSRSCGLGILVTPRGFNFDTYNTGYNFLGQSRGSYGNTVGDGHPIGDGSSWVDYGPGKRGGNAFWHHVGDFFLDLL